MADATLDLLISLRGGLPDACNFCGQPLSESRQPVPEEAGEWACTECLARWSAEDEASDGQS